MKLRHEKLTAAIIECIFETHNEIGIGLDEETYHQSLIESFLKKGISTISKERKYLVHRGISIRKFELDLLVFDKIILALKALPCDFLQNHYVQIISELKLWQKDLGLLVNLGQHKAKIERIPFDEKEKKIVEDYAEIKRKIDKSTRQLLAIVRDTIFFVYESHGLGYGKTVCRDLLQAELNYREVPHNDTVLLNIKYRGKSIRTCKVKVLSITDQLLCGVIAIQDQINLFDVMRMRTYLRHSNIPIGLLVNFGKNNLEIKAISP